MRVSTALRSVVLALVFLTGVSLYAFRKVFKWLEELEEARQFEPQHLLPPPPRDPWRVLP